ncbi:GAF domain-containing sensor histidine kinase [Paracoccus nototheniae]|uniref:histidine kinase n=1 Tax=Paracoccus nototheniae TaxID=2489002 RepID=A0ABW4DX27_9RHOB|nr:ATP-binding protein [Paracoccus nototheniae]
MQHISDAILGQDPGPMLPHLFRISRALAGRLDFASTIRAVADEVIRFLPYDHLDVCVLSGDGTLSAAYETGIHTAWGRIEAADLASSPLRSLFSGAVDHIITDDARHDPRFHFPGAFVQPIHDHDLRARVHAPLIVSGQVIGALSLSSCAAGRYGMRDMVAARYVADLIAPYIFALREGERSRRAAIIEAEARAREEGLRLGALNLTEALEQERQRIGMDLHDQTLADLSRLIRDLSRHGGPDAEAVLTRLNDCVTDLRRIIDTAVPSILQMFGLAHALRIHLERAVDGGTQIDVRDASGDAADILDPVALIALFRIAQEAINNAARHARATRIEVRIRCRAGLRLSVVDNGCGLPTGAHRARRGGLSHMRTRAQLIGARLAIRSGPTGASVTVCVPLPQHTSQPQSAPQPISLPGSRP